MRAKAKAKGRRFGNKRAGKGKGKGKAKSKGKGSQVSTENDGRAKGSDEVPEDMPEQCDDLEVEDRELPGFLHEEDQDPRVEKQDTAHEESVSIDPEASSSSKGPDPAPGPASVIDAIASAPATTRASVTKTRTNTQQTFQLEGLKGHLTYYPKLEAIQAFCHRHGPECRKQRTVKASDKNLSQGRCIGYLVAWLRKAHEYKDQQEHCSRIMCVPSLKERQESRDFFMSLPNSGEFAGFERALRDGESPEPINFS